MVASVDVAVIGAGPYGLSIAAHLKGQGVDHRIFGEPMQMWRDHMPPGMQLKSDGKASDLSAPGNGYTLEAFCGSRGMAYDRALIPVKLENFVAYGVDFQERFVPRIERKRLTRLDRANDAFDLEFDDGDRFSANNVVLAIGVLPFKSVPAQFSTLPAELASHSSAFGPMDHLNGRDVVIVGGGSSGLDLAALLYARGTNVTLLNRGSTLAFHGTPPAQERSLYWRLRAPDSKIGAGWLHRICDDAPQLIHALPRSVRHQLVEKMLGPSGGYFVKDQVLGKVAVKLGTVVSAIGVHGERAIVQTQSGDGDTAAIQADHVIFATGYRVNTKRLGFLSGSIIERLQTAYQAPVLSRNFESSVRGLYFAGFASASSFGPVMRFVAGAPHPAKRLARHLATRYKPSVNVSFADAVG